MKILDVMILLLSAVNAQKDLSFSGTPSQSSDYYWMSQNASLTADLAISGEPTDIFENLQCSGTEDINQNVAWWMFTFPVDTVFITNVKIDSRPNTLYRLAGYSLYVSNSNTSKTDGYLCYHHEGPLFPSVNQDRSCNHLGKYVIIYNERNESVEYPDSWDAFAVLELCKVRIYGCYKGWWGSDCSTPCAVNCTDEQCYPGNGSCVWDCKIGQDGDMCEKLCNSGTFGFKCANSCYCLNQPCNPSTGICPPGGCRLGYTGKSCNIECSIGNYGYNCNRSCDGCLSNSCNKEDGECTNTTGCKPGWQSVNQTCDKVCDDGYFGDDCESQCYCRNDICDKPTGMCPGKQCHLGWTGEFCNQGCSEGYYGYDCAHRCETCNNTLCGRYEGNCKDGCVEGFKGHQCLDSVQSSAKNSEIEPPINIIGPIAGGISAVVVVSVVVVILVIFIRHRSHSNKTKYRESRHSTNSEVDETDARNKQHDGAVGLTTATDNVKISISNERVSYESSTEDHVSDEEGGNGECVYSNREDTTKYRIPVTELQNVINEKHKVDGFLKEYDILPKGLVRPHVEGSKEENKIKNRFLTTWPYDHSRVILQGNASSDYINASYIDSYSRERAYIASQGPKKNTIKEFWQMVWQEKVDIIVMVTKLEEDRRSNSERTVHHFHFTQWPDHGVPVTIKLVSFYRKVKSTTTCLNGPMVVHCSAGVGRTGTFLAIDALYEHGQKTGYIDIMEYVQMMRKDRMNMIQTKEQYTTVFEALLEAFTVPETAIDKDHFCNYLENQQLHITPKNQTFQKLEFQKLKDIQPTYPDKSYKAAVSRENAAKNAVQSILPHDDYRPFLMSYEKSRNDYINAVIIPGYVGTGKYLVTQYPLQDTVVDFWSMVYDTDSTVVVMLESVDESVPLWPHKGVVFHFSEFNVSVKSDDTSFPFSLTLNHKDTNRSVTVRIFSMDDWNAENVPSSGICILNLLNTVSSWRTDHPGSVTAVCQDGCKRSGVFAALSLVLEKMELDDEVDIFQVVRTIQVRRPEFFPSFNQYEYCYQCIKEHLDGHSVYVNA